MRFRRILAAVLTAAVAGVLAVTAAPQPAAADGPVYLQLLWIRCQDDTGEWGADEIWVDVSGRQAGLFLGFDAGEHRTFVDSTYFHPVQQFVGDTLTIAVWEKDEAPIWPFDWDLQGRITVHRSLVNTGDHEGYAFDDGEYIVGYRVISA